MMSNKTDEQLMLEVKNGELDSLAPLFEKYHVRLFNFFLRMTQNTNISEDLTQNVFSRILSYRESYNDQWKFKSWMYQIARNAKNKHFQLELLLTDTYADISDLEGDTNLSTLEENETALKNQHLMEALKKLTPEQQEIIELSRFQGLKYQEIAQITGNTVAAIKVKMHRAIQKLRTYYFELA